MRRLVASLAAVFLTASGCDSAPKPTTSASPALWQIETAGGEVEGWLFGTIHALPDGIEWRTGTFDEAFAEAEILAVEIADFDNPGIARKLATTRGLGPLRQRVSPDRREALQSMMREADLRDGQFSNTEDWAAAIALAHVGRDADPANGVDQTLIREARSPFTGRAPIRVVELEGLYEQLSIFDMLPARDQRDMLHSAIDEFDTDENEAELLRQQWLTGDEVGLTETVAESFADTPGLYKALMTDRNTAMASKVIGILKTEDQPMVAVGAAHMLGSDGLAELIRAQGYQVRRIQ